MEIISLRQMTLQDVADFLGIPNTEMTLTQNRGLGELSLTVTSALSEGQRSALRFFLNSSMLLEDIPAGRTDATLISLTPAQGIVSDTVTSEIRMQRAPNGLAGFTIVAHIGDPRVARITDVTFPLTFPLASHTPDPVNGPTVRLSGVDLGAVINAGDTDILLATLSIELLEEGFAALSLLVTRLDDDSGFDIPRVSRTGAIVTT